MYKAAVQFSPGGNSTRGRGGRILFRGEILVAEIHSRFSGGNGEKCVYDRYFFSERVELLRPHNWGIEVGKNVEKAYIFNKILHKMVSESLFFTACNSKRGMIFQLRDLSIRMFFRRCRAQMRTQERSECPPPHTHARESA